MVISEKIISKHIIKPSSPTPNRFIHHKLSYLDQIQPRMYLPLIFFYQNDKSKLKQQVEISQSLKQSLSQILTVFYPLAGTIRGNSFVDCNDTGVEFVEAQIHASLAQVIEEPKVEELEQFVPRDSLSHNENVLLSVKISFFDCGGIAIGVCWSHKIGDFASFIVFMNAWAATCRGETQVIRPSFDLANHFPPKESPPVEYSPCKEKITMKRFIFDREKLERLKQQASSGELKNPTRVEALSAFIWQQFIEATKAKSDAKKMSFALALAVNLRPRTVPPIPDHSFGNCSNPAIAFVNETTDNSHLISKLRVAVRAVDNDYIKKIINDENYLKIQDREDGSVELDTKYIGISSLWRFPAYDVDFGWGKPVWVHMTTLPFQDSVILMSTPSEEGIEAWVSMGEDFLQMIETNYNRIFQ